MSIDNPRHGSYLGYLTDKCRHECCRSAWRKYQNDRSRAIAYGRYEPRTHIDPAAARAKILDLRAAGLSSRTIAASTGVASAIIELLEYGQKKWIYPDTERRVLAFNGVTVDQLVDRARIDSTGTVRRLQALCAIGWSFADIADRMGCTQSNVSALSREKFTRAGTARTVAQIYGELWNKPAPPGYRRTRALLHAERNGWVSPLAWDDDTIDDPNATPDLGAETPRSHGGQGRPFADVVEDVEDILSWEPYTTATELAHRLGYRDSSGIQIALRRGERTDLLAQLARNAEVKAA